MSTKSGLRAITDIVRRRLGRAIGLGWNRWRSRLALRGARGFEVHGSLMERHKMAGQYQTLQQITQWAAKLSQGRDDLYFYSAAGDGYRHAVQLSSADDGLKIEVLPATSEEGIWVKTVAAGDVERELVQILDCLPDFERANIGFEYRRW